MTPEPPRIVVKWGDTQSQTVPTLPDDLYMPVSEHEEAVATLTAWIRQNMRVNDDVIDRLIRGEDVLP